MQGWPARLGVDIFYLLLPEPDDNCSVNVVLSCVYLPTTPMHHFHRLYTHVPLIITTTSQLCYYYIRHIKLAIPVITFVSNHHLVTLWQFP